MERKNQYQELKEETSSREDKYKVKEVRDWNEDYWYYDTFYYPGHYNKFKEANQKIANLKN